MNWGKGILIAMIAFIAFIVFLVVRLVSQNVELESTDYYQQEIAYQDEIESIQNANNLADKPLISVNETHLVVQLNGDQAFSKVNLSLERPNNSSADQQFAIEGTRTFTVPTESLESGRYNVELSYEVAGKHCLQKTQIYLP